MPVTRILKINPHSPEENLLLEATTVLRNGGLVAFPTETVYGLGANALDARAVSRIFAAKGRPPTDPLIVHIASTDDLKNLVPDAPALAYQLADKFWPGPLTLLVNKPDIVAPNVSGGLPSIGVRVPSHPVARNLIRTARLPVAAPSANLFSHTSPTRAEHVLDDLDGRVDLILDGGPCMIGVESTVLNILVNPPEILRPGGVSLEALQSLLPDVRLRTGKPVQESESAISPGMLLKHYAPRTPLQVITGPSLAVQEYITGLEQGTSQSNQRIGLLMTDEMADSCSICRSNTLILLRLGPGHDLDKIASHLFAALRSIDQAGVGLIIAVEPENMLEDGGLALAIHDRLVRAASGNYLKLQD